VLGLAAAYAVLPRGLIHGPIEGLQFGMEDEALALALTVQWNSDMERIEPVVRRKLEFALAVDHGNASQASLRFLAVPDNSAALLQRDATALRPLLNQDLIGRNRRTDRHRGAKRPQDPVVWLDLMDAEGQFLRIVDVTGALVALVVAWHLIVRMRCQRFQQVSLTGNLRIGT
jgi:hypothetical protein